MWLVLCLLSHPGSMAGVPGSYSLIPVHSFHIEAQCREEPCAGAEVQDDTVLGDLRIMEEGEQFHFPQGSLKEADLAFMLMRD